MRKYLFIILLALCCIAAGRMYDYGSLDLYGEGNLKFVDEIESGTGVSNHCDACPTGDPSEDIWCEDASGAITVTGTDFDTAVCSWDASALSSGNTISEVAPTGDSCDVRGSYAIEFVVDDANGEQATLIEDAGINDDEACFQFRFTVDSSTMEDDDEVSFLLLDANNGSDTIGAIGVQYDTDGLYLKLWYEDSGGTLEELTDSGGTTLSVGTGTWYKAAICWDRNDGSDGARAFLAGVETLTSDTNSDTTADKAIDRIELGSDPTPTSLDGSGDAITFRINIFQGDTSLTPFTDPCL